jgi:exosortase
VTAVVWVFLPLVLAYAGALKWCWDLWWIEGGYFAHGPLVPLVMAAVIWRRRATWRDRPAVVDARAFWLLGPALLVHLCGAALTIDSLSAASLVLAVPGAAWLALGRLRLRGLWPALWLFAFAVPLPLYVSGRLAFELKELAVQGGLALAQGTGLAVERAGAWLHVPGQTTPLDVADPCGGLRSLLAMVTLVYCIAFFVGPARAARRTVLLLVSVPVALGVNMLRIAAICWAAHQWGVPFATGTGHDVLNALAWIVDLGLVLGIDYVLTARTQPRVTPAEPEYGVPEPERLRRCGAWLWAASLPLLVLSLYRPYTESRGRAATLPEVVGPFAMVDDYPMTPRMHELLGTGDACWRSYSEGEGEPLYVVALFHGSNWKSVHPPHICLLGSDMDLERDGVTGLDESGTEEVGRIVTRTRADGRPYLSLYAYGARGLCTGSYWNFFLHHVPRALFRSSNEGFLLRVEAFADGPGGLPAAEARCRTLLVQLLDRARTLLP